jgi:hypothetical protein
MSRMPRRIFAACLAAPEMAVRGNVLQENVGN